MLVPLSIFFHGPKLESMPTEELRENGVHKIMTARDDKVSTDKYQNSTQIAPSK